MSEVIINGVQYEHCCRCGKFVALSALLYANVRSDLTPRWPQYETQDLCTECAEPETDPDLEAELQLDDDRWAEALMRACERDSPNSFGFDALIESIYKQLCAEGWHP